MGIQTFSIRMDENLKNNFDALCKEFGMNITTAINIFAKTVVREKRIPFDISINNSVRNEGLKSFLNMRKIIAEKGLNTMTLDDINNEIALARAEND